MRASHSSAQGGSRSNRGWPGHRHPKTATPQTVPKDTEAQTAPPQLAYHIAPRLTLQTRKPRKLTLAHSPNPAPIDPV